jgi:LysM repeat protein
MRLGLVRMRTAFGVSAAVLGFGLLGPGLAYADPDRSSENAQHESSTRITGSGSLSGWLEYAATTYQSDVAGKLAVPRQATAAADVSLNATTTFVEMLRKAADASMDYIQFWIGQASEAVGIAPAQMAGASIVTLVDQTARDARSFVEARRKAELDWHDAVAKADAAAADVAQKESDRKNAAGGAAAEAEKKRAEARKEELRKIKEDLDRRIEEGLKKLEDLEKLDTTKKTEATRRAIAADAANVGPSVMRAIQERKTRAEADRKAKEETRLAEAKAAEDQRVAEAERMKKEDDARKAAEAEKARQAEIKAAEARRKSEAERIAREDAERKAAQAKKAAEVAEKSAADAAAKREAEAKARAAAQRQMAEARAAYSRSIDAAQAGTGAAVAAANPSDDERQAEIRQAQERRVEAAKAEYARKVADAQTSGTDKASAAKTGHAAADVKQAEPKETVNPARTTEMTKSGQVSQQVPEAAEEKKMAAAANPPSEVVATREAAPRKARAEAGAFKKKTKAKVKAQKARRDVARVAKRKKPAYIKRGRTHVYVVKRGDTLWAISRRYLGSGKRYPALVRANRGRISNPDLIFPGQKLRLS